MINYYKVRISLADGDLNLHSCVSCDAFMYVCCKNQSYWDLDIHDTCNHTISRLLYMLHSCYLHGDKINFNDGISDSNIIL